MGAVWVGAVAGLIMVLICHWAKPVYANAIHDD